MKSKSLIAKIAVTAMAAAALGSPVAAFAAAGPALADRYALSQAPLSHSPEKVTFTLGGGAAKAIPSSAILQLPDPSEVAAKYAPDAVEEWKKTLASYNKLAPVKTLSLSAAVVSSSDSVQPAQPAAPVAIRKGSLSETGSVTLQMAKPVEGSIVTAPATLTFRAGGTVVMAAAAASPAGAGILQGRIALGKAVETGEAEKIKQALDTLLSQYKAAIAELQQAE